MTLASSGWAPRTPELEEARVVIIVASIWGEEGVFSSQPLADRYMAKLRRHAAYREYDCKLHSIPFTVDEFA